MTEVSITVEDQDGVITLTREDFIKYATKANTIAAALMVRLCHYAFALLSPEAPVLRRKLYWTIGTSGQGFLDCIELISHAVREGRCLQKITTDHAEAPHTIYGQIIFAVNYNKKSLLVWPDKHVFDDEFRTQMITWQEASPETQGRKDYLAFKDQKVKQIMSLPDAKLFHSEWSTL